MALRPYEFLLKHLTTNHLHNLKNVMAHSTAAADSKNLGVSLAHGTEESMHTARVLKLQNTKTANNSSRGGDRNDEYLIPGLEPEEALDVRDDGGAELLGGGGGLDLVDHGERGGLEAPPRVGGDGRGVRVRRHGLGHRRALADVHHGHPRERAASRLLASSPELQEEAGDAGTAAVGP